MTDQYPAGPPAPSPLNQPSEPTLAHQLNEALDEYVVAACLEAMSDCGVHAEVLAHLRTRREKSRDRLTALILYAMPTSDGVAQAFIGKAAMSHTGKTCNSCGHDDWACGCTCRSLTMAEAEGYEPSTYACSCRASAIRDQWANEREQEFEKTKRAREERMEQTTEQETFLPTGYDLSKLSGSELRALIENARREEGTRNKVTENYEWLVQSGSVDLRARSPSGRSTRRIRLDALRDVLEHAATELGEPLRPDITFEHALRLVFEHLEDAHKSIQDDEHFVKAVVSDIPPDAR